MAELQKGTSLNTEQNAMLDSTDHQPFWLGAMLGVQRLCEIVLTRGSKAARVSSVSGKLGEGKFIMLGELPSLAAGGHC